MTDVRFLPDDKAVDAKLEEVAGLLRRLIDDSEGGSIDLRGLPLPPSCIETLDQCLGHGEIIVVMDAAGRSEIRETSLPGVWWTKHADGAGRVIAMLIEAAVTPGNLRADVVDMKRGQGRLPGLIKIACRTA
jgi:hydrogenase-1 operon protein HyaF